MESTSQFIPHLKEGDFLRVMLKKSYWKENTFWSDGYFVCSTGDANMETIKKYIEEQG